MLMYLKKSHHLSIVFSTHFWVTGSPLVTHLAHEVRMSWTLQLGRVASQQFQARVPPDWRTTTGGALWDPMDHEWIYGFNVYNPP